MVIISDQQAFENREDFSIMADSMGYRTNQEIDGSGGLVWGVSSFVRNIRDLANIVQGRDPEMARQVRDLGLEAQRLPNGSLNAIVNGVNLAHTLQFSGIEQAAALRVMDRPEFREIRDRYDMTLQAVVQSGQAAGRVMSGRSAIQSRLDDVYFHPAGIVAALSDYDTMAPILRIKALPPLDPKLEKDFDDAVKQEATRAAQEAVDRRLSTDYTANTGIKTPEQDYIDGAKEGLAKRMTSSSPPKF